MVSLLQMSRKTVALFKPVTKLTITKNNTTANINNNKNCIIAKTIFRTFNLTRLRKLTKNR